MSLINVIGSVENGVGCIPSTILINTSDSLSTVMGTGYLNTWPGFTFLNSQLALVVTTQGLVWLQVSIVGSNTSLIYPVSTPSSITSLVTSPSNSSSSSLALGTSYQNTLGYDVMLTVYLNVTAALSANILLGVGSTSTPTQQTIVSGLTLSVLGVIPVSIYVPAGYYAKLSTSGTITVSISGQMAMPI